MNLNGTLRSILDSLATGSEAPPVVVPGRWHVLFGRRKRPLLMSEGDYQLQKRWLSYFIGDRLRSAYARTSLKLNAIAPRVHLLPEVQLPETLSRRIPSVPCGVLAAIQIGTPGPYQKASALLITEKGEGVALAKIALVPGADRMIVSEAGWLRLLQTEKGLTGEVPRLLTEGVLRNGRRYLVMTLSPMTMTTTEFTAVHERFLGRLGRSRMDIRRYGSSACRDSLERSFTDIAPSMTRQEAAEIRGALQDCHDALSDFACPFTLSQGDFAWWNIRAQRDGIFVFDWEYASSDANPLADFFHYHLIHRAAAGRSLGRWFLAGVMMKAEAFARRHYPELQWRSARVRALALAYLLDVMFQYARSYGGRMDFQDHVVRSYWSLTERRSTWAIR